MTRLMPSSIWLRGGFGRIQGLGILGITHERTMEFPALDLELWGNAHRDYHDMVPLRRPAAALRALARRDRPRPLRAARDLAQPAAPVLADQRRR